MSHETAQRLYVGMRETRFKASTITVQRREGRQSSIASPRLGTPRVMLRKDNSHRRHDLAALSLSGWTELEGTEKVKVVECAERFFRNSRNR